nr:GMP reductase [Azospirillum lipoferum]
MPLAEAGHRLHSVLLGLVKSVGPANRWDRCAVIIESDLKLDFKDVLIRPKRSTLQSRNDVDVNRTFTFLHTQRDWTGFPLIAANMDVTGSMGMARALSRFGAMTALHKHYKADELAAFFRAEAESAILSNVFYSMGIAEADHDKFQAVKAKAPVGKICLDVANGYTERFVEVIARLREENPDTVIMAGNVVTGDMTEALLLAGADIVKVGIGPGSVCTTRKMTGVGYPQLSAIIECADAAHGLKGQVCGDGGCTVPGDISKAYGAGADFVMLGGMLAGHDECEGEIRYEDRDGNRVPVAMTFYGMSSDTAMHKYSGGVASYRASEGKTVEVPYRGPVENTMQEIMGGVRSMMTYIGATRLKEVPKRTTFVRVGAQLNTVFGG